MEQKKMYKVLAVMPRHDGTGDFFMKVGVGFKNRDESINMHLDVMPLRGDPKRGVTLQLREMDENDLRQRESYRANRTSGSQPTAAADNAPPF